MIKLPHLVKYKLEAINRHFTPFQKKRMQANLEKIIYQMAEGQKLLRDSIEYEFYTRDVAVKYINKVYDKLCESFKSRKDRNVVPFQELLPKDIF